MARLTNDPRDFASEMTEGFVAANPSYVRAVPGGVVRVSPVTEGKVAVVIGGGSGHYPAFAGLVGPGIAAGAAMGNVFASPAAAQVVSVARAAERGSGVLLTYGNYAGDVLNFDEAQQILRDDGIACETVVVTDDISSAPVELRQLRRGVAGDLVVFKCAGAAAECGYALADVVRVARLANDRTRTIGAALSGCTLPGADEPLFTVPPGRMGLGMGIHGEPGLREVDLPSADGLAEMLVEELLTEAAAESALSGTRVVPILNGLGSVKHEELFVVYRRTAEILRESGLTIVDPQVGEFCTSFDMAGLSLTLVWLDDELEELWGAPADTPAFRRTMPAAVAAEQQVVHDASVEQPASIGSSASQQLAARIVTLLAAAAAAVDDEAGEFGRLDAVAGDGDHGIGMQRGVNAALAAAESAARNCAGAGTVLRQSGEAWAAAAGGTSGALWGAALMSLGESVGDREVPPAESIGDLIWVAATRVQERGGAQVGDKTVVDALAPFADVLTRELAGGAPVTDAVARAAWRARLAAASTANLVPRVGRARPHAERSLGVRDPGAYSFAVIVTAAAGALAPTNAAGSG